MENNLHISKMTLEDLNNISSNLQTDFDDFWNYNILKKELENSNSYYVVLKLDNEIIGFAGITIILDIAEINNIVIKKLHRKKGYSKFLINHLIDYCKNNNINQINLEVSSENNIALNLYTSFGFKQNGLRKGYYNGKDAILMSLNIM